MSLGVDKHYCLYYSLVGVKMPEIILVGFTDAVSKALEDKIILILSPVVADPKSITCKRIKSNEDPCIIVRSTPNDLGVVTRRLKILGTEVKQFSLRAS